MFISKIEFGGQIMLIEEKLTKQELFTTTEKRIVDYIRRNIEAAVYMTKENGGFIDPVNKKSTIAD